MPILTVKISGKKSQELTSQVGKLLMDLTSRILKKKREVTAIAIEYVDHDSWFVGGKLLSEAGKNSFYFDIKITDETNTKDEKARYIKEAYEGFDRLLGKPFISGAPSRLTGAKPLKSAMLTIDLLEWCISTINKCFDLIC